MEASAALATSNDPTGKFVAVTDGTSERIYRDVGTVVDTGTPVGGGQSHENRQPYLAVTFIIALTGIFPSRN